MASTYVKLPNATSVDVGVTGANGAIQFSDGAGDLASDATKIFWDDTNNRLGVGTNTPGFPLEVKTGSSAYGAVHSDGTTKLATFVDNGFGYLGTQSNHKLAFFTNDSAAQLILATDGKLGIGVDSPTAWLEITAPLADELLRLVQNENGRSFRLKLPSLSASYTLTLPDGDGDSGQVLKTNGSGVTSWTYDLVSPDTNAANTTTDILLTSGDNTNNAADNSGDDNLVTGNIDFTTGTSNSNVNSATTGYINLQTGSQTGTKGVDGEGGSGRIQIFTGSANNSFSGTIQIATGASNWQSGDVFIDTGAGEGTDGYSGEIFLRTAGVADAASQVGHIHLQPGLNPSDDSKHGKIKAEGVFKLHSLDADPSTGENGDMYYNTTTHKFRGYANGAWIDLH